jgi:predicted ArsR family transcriptional regulator
VSEPTATPSPRPGPADAPAGTRPADDARPNGHANGHANGHRNGHAPDDAHGRAILLALREGGSAGPDAIAERVGMSRTSTLQRLRELEAAGFVARQALRHGVGRPRHVYDITPAAQRSLPANWDGLATTLLESIAEVGGDLLVEEVFQARRRLLRDRIRARFAERLGPAPTLADKVRELAVVQDEAGYLCRAETAPTNGAALELREHNCAILGAAAGHPAACRAELELFEEVLDARVVRTSHIASGDRCCSYRIEPREG